MNQLIRQLAYQTCSESGIADSKNPEYFMFDHSSLEKFVELIVRESIEAMRSVPYNSDREFGDEVIYQDAVKKHFGVEK